MMRRAIASHARRGFTLIELLVAVMITAGIAGATVMALSQALRAGESSRERQETMMRADALVGRIARDVQGVVREGDLFYARILITDRRVNRQDRDELLVFTTMNRRLRSGSLQNEGGEYEVQYRLVESKSESAGDPLAGVLWRRIDPVPDEVPDGGGMAIPIGSGISALSVEAFDGRSWQTAWDSDRDGYPYAVRVAVTAQSDDSSRFAIARRVVALDRVPPTIAVPVQTEPEEGGSRS